ncbi:choice-of-anchor A family protein [Streptacidiphilus sp. MAP5-3]|uniref:choice-of-anchor A family protein n=1 Tax=unclassified Streptacidiphilus TaxID=2643834 RepID=UPI003511C220
MRHAVSSSAALIASGSLALAVFALATTSTDAQAAPSTGQCGNPLGAAASYTEFVHGDSQRTADAEGAVAVGGDADFSHSFSVGAKLTSSQIAALPSGAALVIGGTLELGSADVEVERGNAVYGSLHGSGRLSEAAGAARQAATPIDFDQTFAALRAASAQLAALPANGSTAVTHDGGESVLTFTGKDAATNVFSLTADTLQAAQEIRIDVPAGSRTVVNVSGARYDMNAGATSSVFLKDPQTGAWHEEDYTEPDTALSGIRGGLLWNFSQAVAVVKRDGTAWPGTLLAPEAAVHLGSGNQNGQVIAASLTSSSGAETHDFPFTGCVATTPSPTPSSSSASPSASPSASSPAGVPSGAPTPTRPATTSSATPSSPGGSLAHTGGGDDTVALLGVGTGVVALGAGLVTLSRRKRSSTGAHR